MQHNEDYVLKAPRGGRTHHAPADRQRAITSKRRARHSRCPDQRRSCLRRGRLAHARSASAHGLDRSLFHGDSATKSSIKSGAKTRAGSRSSRSAFGETGLIVAVGNPLDIDTIDSLSFLLQREIELVCTSPAENSRRTDQILRDCRRSSRRPAEKNRRRHRSRIGNWRWRGSDRNR